MTEHQPIDTAPHDGTDIKIVWIANDRVELEKRAHWLYGQWVGDGGAGWAPTHWLPEALPFKAI